MTQEVLQKIAQLKKPKIAFVSLTSCEGCMFAALDLGKRFFDLFEKVELGEFWLIEEMKESNHYDIALVEGNIITKKNVKTLKHLRKKSDYLIVFGNCADLGGIPKLKNWQNKNQVIKRVYKKYRKIDNPKIVEVKDVVSVDFTIPTCPVNGEELLQVIYQVLQARQPEIRQNPVCYECQTNGYPCILQRGEVCFGPITQGGCNAVCLKSGQGCWACRGLLDRENNENIINHLKIIEKIEPQEKAKKLLEVFGVRDHYDKKLKLKKNHD